MNFEKQHMVNWILTRVNKGITPKLVNKYNCVVQLQHQWPRLKMFFDLENTSFFGKQFLLVLFQFV